MTLPFTSGRYLGIMRKPRVHQKIEASKEFLDVHLLAGTNSVAVSMAAFLSLSVLV